MSKKPESATKRLAREFRGFMKNSLPGIVASPEDGNLLKWECNLEVLDKESLYFGQTFVIEMKFTKDYPYKAPKCAFKTQIYHPNICLKTGEICLDVLKDNWSAAYDTRTILISIQQLIDDANPDSPLNVDAAIMFRKGKEIFKKELERFSKVKNKKEYKTPTEILRAEKPVETKKK